MRLKPFCQPYPDQRSHPPRRPGEMPCKKDAKPRRPPLRLLELDRPKRFRKARPQLPHHRSPFRVRPLFWYELRNKGRRLRDLRPSLDLRRDFFRFLRRVRPALRWLGYQRVFPARSMDPLARRP